MGSQSSGEYELDSVIPFAPAAKNVAADDQLDKAGQTILQLHNRIPPLLATCRHDKRN
jgi:hypothetical protein